MLSGGDGLLARRSKSRGGERGFSGKKTLFAEYSALRRGVEDGGAGRNGTLCAGGELGRGRGGEKVVDGEVLERVAGRVAGDPGGGGGGWHRGRTRIVVSDQLEHAPTTRLPTLSPSRDVTRQPGKNVTFSYLRFSILFPSHRHHHVKHTRPRGVRPSDNNVPRWRREVVKVPVERRIGKERSCRFV